MHRRARIASTSVVALLLLVVSIGGAPIATADQTSSINVPVAHIEGRGHGHGVGMSQWGAYTLAQQGRSAAEILSVFYPGTTLGTAGGEVRVVLQRADRVVVRFPGGGEIRSTRDGQQQAAGFPVRVAPGGAVELVRDAAGNHVLGGAVTPVSASGAAVPYQARECFLLVFCEPEPKPEPQPTPRPSPTPTDPPSGEPGPGPSPTEPPTTTTGPGVPTSAGTLWAVSAGGSPIEPVAKGRSYRGVLAFGDGVLRNHVDIEDYLKGMGEVPGSWPAAAVQAQAVAARTYAMRAVAGGGDICDTDSCQVYGGVGYEKPGQTAAVDATRGTVVLWQGALASTFYSASGGGHTATVAEGFGSAGDVPYLQANPYPTVDPRAYSLDIALSDVAARLGYPGTIGDIRIDEKGPSGRALRMTIVGDAGEQPVDPQDFRRRLGLRSTLFTVTTSSLDEAPPPPAPLGEGADVVGTELPADVDLYRAPPARGGVRGLEQASSAVVGSSAVGPAGPPLALVALAVLLIGLGAVGGTALVADRRRLHPAFALLTTLADVTMGRWRIRRR